MKTEKEFKLFVSASGTLDQISDALRLLANEIEDFNPLDGDEVFEDNVLYAELTDTGEIKEIDF